MADSDSEPKNILSILDQMANSAQWAKILKKVQCKEATQFATNVRVSCAVKKKNPKNIDFTFLRQSCSCYSQSSVSMVLVSAIFRLTWFWLG